MTDYTNDTTSTSPYFTMRVHVLFVYRISPHFRRSCLYKRYVSGDGKCVICDSFVNPQTMVHVCDECNYGSNENRCVVCGNSGVTDAYYCRECVQQEKDRDGCPKVVNLGAVSETL